MALVSWLINFTRACSLHLIGCCVMALTHLHAGHTFYHLSATTTKNKIMLLFIRYNLTERGRVLDVTVPGAQGGQGGASIWLLEIRWAQRVAQRFVQVDAGLGEEICGVWELHWRACDLRGAWSSRGAVTRRADRTQAGRSTYRHKSISIHLSNNNN